MVYDHLNATNGFADILTYMNTVTNNVFWTFALFIIFIILVLSMRNSFERNIPAAMYITTLLGMLLRIINLISDYAIIVCVIGTGLSVFWSYFSNKT
jgi:hypothetical protein